MAGIINIRAGKIRKYGIVVPYKDGKKLITSGERDSLKGFEKHNAALAERQKRMMPKW